MTIENINFQPQIYGTYISDNALWTACRYNHKDIALLLIKYDEDIDAIEWRCGSLMMLAAQNGLDWLAQLLIKLHPNKNYILINVLKYHNIILNQMIIS